MKNKHFLSLGQRSPILWSLLGIASSYPLFWVMSRLHVVYRETLAFSSPLWEGLACVGTGAFRLVACGVFIAFCLWWWRARQPFVSVLVLLSSLSCTSFSMNAIRRLIVWMVDGGDYWLAAFAVTAHILLVLLCLQWRRTQDAALRVWLLAVLVACSPFGMGGLYFLFS